MVLDKIILISFPVILLISFFLVKNYNLLFLENTKDSKFNKPQAFHSKATPRIGGFLIFIFLTTFLIIFYKKDLFFYFLCKYFSDFGYKTNNECITHKECSSSVINNVSIC